VARWSGWPAVTWLAISLFFLLPPIAAWHYGALSPFAMGLTELDWVASLSAGAAPLAAVIGLLIFGWLVFRRTLPEGQRPTRIQRVGRTLRAPVDVALLQWHWHSTGH